MTDPCKACSKSLTCTRRCFPKKDYERSRGSRRNIKNTNQEIFRMATCKKCGARIIWIRSTKGKWLPADEGLVPYKENPIGRDRVITENGEVLNCALDPEKGTETGRARIPHWATCPYADEFRKGG